MAGIDNASKYRSKEDEERLARQKAKAPTNVKRAKELAKQYSNPYKFSNNKTVAKTITGEKWYSGNTPTARETYARMYTVAGGDDQKMSELQNQYIQEASTRGSVLYNPYSQATNYKAIQGLAELGVDVPDKITDQWIDNMWSQYGKYSRETTTGYGPSAPTTKSTRENDIAYWVGTLLADKDTTNLAEAQLGDMYKEVEYLTKQGYSDAEVLKRVRADFGSKYNVLNNMDNARLEGDAVRLNRKVDYMGDDTIYGMIWAARNGGSSGDYLADAAAYTLGWGNKYKPDPNSEAALDPSNYEGYAPYRGSTLHDLNMKYGVTEFNADWLEKNRGMLSDPEQAKDWRKVNDAVKSADLAATELGALDQWVEKKVADGKTGEEIKAELDALLENGDELRYTDADGKRQAIKLTTLAKMEEKRAEGDALSLAYGVDFGVPAYKAKIDAMTGERDALAAQVAAEESAKDDNNIVTKIGNGIRDGWNWLMGEKGALNDVTEAQTIDTMTSMESMAQEYARNVFGVEITGELKPHEEKVFKEVIGKANMANLPGATREQIEEANVASAVLQDLFTGIIADPERRVSETVTEEPAVNYRDMEAYQTVLGDQKPEPREGMAELVPETVSFTANQPAEAETYAPAYEQMLQGGEWDGDAYGWALSNSSNKAAVNAELGQGIIDIMGGKEGNPLARSWYNKFGGMVANVNQPARRTGLSQGEREVYGSNPEMFDSQRAYGTAVYDALKVNEEAFDTGLMDKRQFVENLVKIASVAEMIEKSAGGARATDEQAAEVLNSFNGSVGEYLATVEADCDVYLEQARVNDEETRKAINSTMDAWIGGQQLDANQQEFVDAVMTADVSGVAKEDVGYQNISAQMQDSLSVDSLLRSGNVFTTGSFETDMMMDHADLQQSGALAYGQGVMLVAQDLLDKEMRVAAAYGMSLDEYYAAYPERARSADQLRAEAETAYSEAWSEFGNTISGLLSTNESLQETEEEPAKISTNDTLNIADVFDLGTQAFCVDSELAIAKTANFALWAWSDQDESVNALRRQYGNDAAAYAADLDKWIGEQGEDSKLAAEVKAAREANVDIFKVGKSVAELDNMQKISNLSGTAANIDQFIAENGSELDSKVYNGIRMIENSTTVMAATAAGGGSYFASLLATITDAGSSAYDRFQQSGNYMAAGWATLATWMAKAGLEKMGFDRYAPEGMGGKLESMMTHARYVMGNMGLFNSLKSPKALSTVMKGFGAALLKGTTDAGSELVEEASQALVDMFADNAVYGKPLASLEQIGGAIKEGVAAAFMSPVFSFGSSIGYASFGGQMGDITFTDFHGNLLSEAEAKLLPEHDGAIMGAAIDFESTAIAIHKGQEALAQIEASSENAAKKQAKENWNVATSELIDARVAQNAAYKAEENASTALQDVTDRMNKGLAHYGFCNFTEGLRKLMEDAWVALDKAREDKVKADERVKAAEDKAAGSRQAYDEANAKVQALYADTMGKLKAEAEQWVVDKFFSGDSEQKKAATQSYLAASKQLMEAKNNLRNAKADLDMYGRGTPRGDAAYSAYGEALLEVDKLTEEVTAAKAEMEAVFSQTVEEQAATVRNEDLTTAELAAEQARAEAEADPMNAKKQAKAELAQSQLKTVRAKQAMEEKRADISMRLNDPRDSVRETAVSEWNALQNEANTAAAESEALQAEYDKTDAQKRLRAAIDNFKQYDNIDLIDEDSANHTAAMDAYAELQAASADAELEQAVGELNKAMESPENAAGISEASRKVNEVRGRKKDEAEAEAQVPVKHIDDRSVEDAADRRVTPFFNENRDSVKDYALAALTEIENDFGQSMPAERIFIQGGKGNGHGSDQDVIGLTRLTSDLIAKYKDARHWSWKQMSDYLSKMRNALENGTTIPNTAAMKHVEAMIDEVLSEGYRTIDGTFIEPSLDYLKYKEATGGRRVDSYVMAQSGVSLYDRHGVGSPITPGLMRAVSDGIRNIAADERTTPAGEHILEIGDKFVYTDGNADNPRISRVITFLYKGVHPDIDAVLKEALYVLEEEGRNQDIKQLRAENLATVSNIFGTEDAFRTYDLEDAGGSEGGAGSGAGGYDRTNGAGSGKQVSPEGNLRYLKTRPDAANSAGDGKVDQNPIEIMRDLTNGIRVGYSPNGPMNEGSRRVSSDVLAFYNEYANGIRVRSKYAGDLAVGLHEFGHAAHARLTGLHATQAMINALPDSVKKSYTDGEMDGEAIAEFVVKYMYGRDLAVKYAGEQFVRDFERMMHADPELNAAIAKGRDQVELWNNAPAAERARSMIKDSTTATQRDKERSKGGPKRMIEKFIGQVFDANEPLRKLGKSVYDAAKWSPWAMSRADVLLKENFIDLESNFIGKSLTQRLDDIGFTSDMEPDAALYGVCQIALERLAQKKPVFAETELSADDLKGIMERIKDNNPIAADAADVLSGFWKDVVDNWLVPSGAMTEDVRNKFWSMYPHYLPTKRVVDVNWSAKDIKSGTFKIHSAKKGGVSLEIINPFQSIIDMTEQAVRSVSRNQVMQEIDAVLSGGGLEWLAKEIPADQAVTKVDTEATEAAMQAALDSGSGYDPELVAKAFGLLDDMEEQWRSTGGTLKPNVISGRRADGTAFYYQIEQGNEDMFRAAMGSKAAANAYLRGVKKIVNAFTQLTTQMNPVFAGKNATRDFWTSVNTGTWATSYLDGAVKWMKGMYDIATNAEGYQEFRAMGGAAHTRYSTGSEKGLAAIRRDVLGKKDSFPVRAAKFGFKVFTLSDFNEMVEANSRYVEYAYGKHDRSTFEGRREAAIAGQNVTVDFGMAGGNEFMQGVLSHIPFGRAALNGTYKSMMMVRDLGNSDPRTRKRAAAALTKTVVNNGIMAAMQAYLLGALFGGDDDDERKQEEYALFTDEIKAGNLLIPLNQDKTNAAGFDRPWLRIPLSQDAISRAVFAFTFNRVTDLADMDELSMDMLSVAKSLMTDSLPGEFVTTNLSNAMMNRTWYGGQIVSDYIMDSRSGVNQYNDDTPSVFKLLSNAIYNALGKEVSPAVLQYCFEQSTGYVGKVIMPLISGDRYTGEWSVGAAIDNLLYSYKKNFTIDPLTSNNLTKDYKAYVSKLEKIVSEAEEGLPITYLAYSLTDAEREEAYSEAQSLLKTLVKATDSENKERWSEISYIEANEGLTNSEKAIQSREIRREIDNITAEAITELGGYMQKYVDRDPLYIRFLNLFNARPTLD